MDQSERDAMLDAAREKVNRDRRARGLPPVLSEREASARLGRILMGNTVPGDVPGSLSRSSAPPEPKPGTYQGHADEAPLAEWLKARWRARRSR